jgi:hypothetical protein
MTIEGRHARVLLAGVRLTMGTAGLLAPDLLIRRLGIDPAAQPAMRYPLRMFGVRTVLIGADLLAGGSRRRQAELLAPVVHGSDTVAAFLARRRGDLPLRAGTTATAISALNLVLSLVNLATRPRTARSLSEALPGARRRRRTAWVRPSRRPLLHG